MILTTKTYNMNPRSSVERLRSKLEEVKALKLRVEILKESLKLQARIAKLHEQLKIAKSVDGIYEEARFEEEQKIHPRQTHPDNSVQGFFRRQALQNGSSASLPEEESVSTATNLQESLSNLSNRYDSSQSSPEEESVSSTASLRESLATWSNRYDGLQY
jgi:hypothetical protein